MYNFSVVNSALPPIGYGRKEQEFMKVWNRRMLNTIHLAGKTRFIKAAADRM
jgi:hypothetical protein